MLAVRAETESESDISFETIQPATLARRAEEWRLGWNECGGPPQTRTSGIRPRSRGREDGEVSLKRPAEALRAELRFRKSLANSISV